MSSDTNRRIAKNTIVLYIRTFITLIISLYTSRVLLQTLGVDDYGVYNIIGGVVVLFSFLSNAMNNSTQRYLNYNIGLNDDGKASKVFSTSMKAHYIIAAIVLVLAETVGLWFVYTQLNIPADRMIAARWVYQFSVITSIVNIVRTPYNASVIAYENMSFFAYTSIAEKTFGLAIVFLLSAGHFDKLILYSLLLCLLSVVLWGVYRFYCRKSILLPKIRTAC